MIVLIPVGRIQENIRNSAFVKTKNSSPSSIAVSFRRPAPSSGQEAQQSAAPAGKEQGIGGHKSSRTEQQPVQNQGAGYPVVNGLFSGPWYYAARYLHRRPSPLKPIKPAYPGGAEALSGRVVIRLFISPEGDVDNYRIEAATPEGPFEASVIEAFAKARYSPGQITGQAVRSQLLIEVNFEPGMPPLPNFQLMEQPTVTAPNQGSASSRGKGN